MTFVVSVIKTLMSAQRPVSVNFNKYGSRKFHSIDKIVFLQPSITAVLKR
jgi:hypothetical protein